MKTRGLRLLSLQGLALGASLLISGGSCAFAQISNNLLPIVTIHALDAFASESGDTGTFVLFRQGPTNDLLNVFCRIGGTASNGVDYVTLSNLVIIPAGSR